MLEHTVGGCYGSTHTAVTNLNCHVPEMITANRTGNLCWGYLLFASPPDHVKCMFKLLMRQCWSPVNSVILLLILLMISQKDACFILLGLPAGLSIKKRKAASETNKFIAEKQNLTHNKPILSEEHQKKY